MLAIIIPFYKLAFFEATLKSLANQTDKRFKVYIGDDASPEDCSSLLKQFERQFNFIFYRFESNIGGISLTQQWERCVALSETEEWLMILGDDDVLGENVVEEFYKRKESTQDVNVIRYTSQVVDEHNNIISSIFYHPIYEKASDSFFRKVDNETRSSLSEYIFKRTAFEKYKFSDFPLAWCSDDMAWLEFPDSKPIFTINNSIVYFRFSNENISGKKDNHHLKEEAKFLFFQKIVQNELFQFNSRQIRILLVTYELLLRNRNQLKISNMLFIAIQYIKIGKINYLFYFLNRQLKKIIKLI